MEATDDIKFDKDTRKYKEPWEINKAFVYLRNKK